MITVNRYAQGAPVLNLDFITEVELSQVRDNFVWAQAQTRIGLKGSVARCLYEADDKFNPCYLSKLIAKVRGSVTLTDLSVEVLKAIAEIAESIGYSNISLLLYSTMEAKRKK